MLRHFPPAQLPGQLKNDPAEGLGDLTLESRTKDLLHLTAAVDAPYSMVPID